MKQQLSILAQGIQKNCDGDGAEHIARAEAAATPQVLWLSYIEEHQLTGTADCLVNGAYSAIRESAICIALGLVRPAVGAMRLQIDLALGWLYFRHHPVEWDRVQRSGDGFKLKSEILQYLKDNFHHFGHRFTLLEQRRTRDLEDPYRLLSAHMHAQSESTVPQIEEPSSLLAQGPERAEAISLLRECSEYINDLYWCVFSEKRYSLPSGLEELLHSRFKTPADLASFYSGPSPATK